MTFNKCSIRGKLYGYVEDETGKEIEDLEVRKTSSSSFAHLLILIQKLKPIEFEEKDDDFEWYDQKLIDAIKKGDKDVHNFFALLSLCHTVMPEEKDGKLNYQAQSPDENALVSAARTFGFVFLVNLSLQRKTLLIRLFFCFQNITQTSITVRLQDKKETYDLLNILDFNNDRKRMSVCMK